MVGFDAKNKDVINPQYLCRSCTLILREPVQLVCGHHRCKTCTESVDGEFIKCAECQEETPKTEVILDRGFKNDMKQLPILCSLCEWNGSFKDYEEHLHQAHPNPICEFCGERFNSTIKLDEHKQKECTRNTASCALKDHGCLDTVYRVQSADHYLIGLGQMPTINTASRTDLKSSNEQHERASDMDIDMGQTVVSSMVTAANENTTIQMQEIYETIDSLASRIQILNDDTQSLHNDSNRLQTSNESLRQDLSTLHRNIQEQSAFLDGVRLNQEILQQDTESLRQQVGDMKYASYDGTLIWKINNFWEKLTNAQSGRQKSIYSPPFYSAPAGYKIRARLFLNGNETGKNTHISLFFVLMRGSYDAILKFPFSYKVTFCLYDQTPQKQHHIHSFLPDTTHESFQRPRFDMNVASGIPQFYPLSMIQQENNPFVQDDTMFIKVMVDVGNIPNTLLPYVLSLNPGLPLHAQQMIIRQELERRAQQQ